MSEYHRSPEDPQPYNPNNDPGFASQQPPKPPESHKVRTTLIVIGSVIVGLIMLSSLIPSGDPKATPPAAVTSVDNGPTPDPVTTPTNKPTKPVEQAPKIACAGQEDRNAPCVIAVGKPFQLGKHTVLTWKVTSVYGTMGITGKAKNTGSEASSMFVDIKFLKGDDVLAVVMCSTNELEPGQTQALSCFGTDTYTKKYTSVTAEATF